MRFRKLSAAFAAAGALAFTTLAEAAPVIDLNGAAAGVTHTATYYGYSFQATSFVSNPTITPDASSTFTSMEITLLNRPDSTSDLLQQIFSIPAGLTLSSYETASGLITVTGSGTAGDYASALAQVGYINTSGNPTQSRRYISVRINDGTEWSEAVIGAMDLMVAPSNPTLTELLVDECSSFNSSNWTVTGTTPTSGSGLLNLTDASIESSSTFTGLPLYMEVTGTTIVSMVTGGSFGVGLYSTTPSPNRFFRYGIGAISGGYFFSSGSGYGLSVLESGFADNTPQTGISRKYTVYLNHRGGMIVEEGFPVEISTLHPTAGHQGNWRLRLSSLSGTTTTIDRVRIGTVTTTNPRYISVPANDATIHDLSTVGLQMVVQHTTSGTPVAIQASQANLTPPGDVIQPIAKFWDIQAVAPGSYTADIQFSVSSSELNAAGLTNDNEIQLYRSSDNGNTWQAISPAEVNRSSGYVKATGVAEFSLWTVGGTIEPTAVSKWVLYQ